MTDRATLADYLAAQGVDHDFDQTCAGCFRARHASELYDVSEEGDVPGNFRCDVCVSHKDRCVAAAAIAALPWPTEEQLNDLRAVRDQILLKTDWTQLKDNIERMANGEPEAWAMFRQQVRQVVVEAKAGVRVEFPEIPESAPLAD